MTHALRKVGYSSQSWLYNDSTVKLGMTPGVYRQGRLGDADSLSTRAALPSAGCSLRLQSTGYAWWTLGENDDRPREGAALEYPRAIVANVGGSAGLLRGGPRILQGQPGEDLPSTSVARVFQRKVWTALQTIPEGSVRSYSDVAALIGEPRAVRAVANACGKNPVPLIVPCHRVVRKDGDLGGYGLGLWRKRSLLDEERKRKEGDGGP